MSAPLGPTGEFPNGKLNADDKGELTIGIATDEKGNVVINFGATPITWIALPPENAAQFAQVILANAKAKFEIRYTDEFFDAIVTAVMNEVIGPRGRGLDDVHADAIEKVKELFSGHKYGQ